MTIEEVEQLPLSEYFKWCNEPTQREILDTHLSSIVMILHNSNSKKRIKAEDIMLTFTKEDKKNKLADELKSLFKSQFEFNSKK